MLVQKDLELIGQIVKTEISAFSSELKSLEESFSCRIKSLEESLGNRITSVEESLGDRITSVEESLGNRITSVEESLGNKITSLEESLGNRITKLEESQIRLEQSIRDTENLLIDELAKTQARIESNFKREIDELKKDNEIITSYYRSVRSDQSAIDMMQKNIFDIYGRLEVLEKNSA